MPWVVGKKWELLYAIRKKKKVPKKCLNGQKGASTDKKVPQRTKKCLNGQKIFIGQKRCRSLDAQLAPESRVLTRKETRFYGLLQTVAADSIKRELQLREDAFHLRA